MNDKGRTTRGRAVRHLALGILPILALGGCAKSPAGAVAGNFTRISFRVRVAGHINPNYIYDVAIHADTDPDPEPQFAPVPVLNANNPNGRVAGSPTHFVEFDALNSQVEPFVLYRFAKREEVQNPSDPTNPIALESWARSIRRRIVNFEQVDLGTSTELRFDLFTDQLVDADADAQNLKSLQVNFLTMNRLANQGSGNRVIDSLGDNATSNLNQYIRIDLRTNQTYSNTVGPGAGLEPTGDSPDPDLDIIDWSVDVQRP